MAADVAIVGAGPYGLSVAAHLRRIKGLDVRVFGEPMEFWKSQMPEGMCLRSPWSASHLSDPDTAFSFDAFRDASGTQIPRPIPLNQFVRYGLWFQQHAVGDVDRRRVSRIEPNHRGWRVILNDDEVITARRVVVASGIGPFAQRPAPLQGLPLQLATHSSEQREVSHLRGKRVIVLGAGQSALEGAALIHEAGAVTELIARTPRIHWLGWRARLQRIGPLGNLLYSPYDIGPAGVSRIVAVPDLVRWFPRPIQNRFRTRSLRPAGASWLMERLANVPITTGQSVRSAEPTAAGLRLTLTDKSTREVDHVVMGTGYRVEIGKYSFLPRDVSSRVRQAQGFPLLGRGFESSLPGLHFVGAPSAWTFGPLMYFVAGTEFAARSLAGFMMSAKSIR